MRVDCQYNHPRIQMEMDHMRKRWVCVQPGCGQIVTTDDVESSIPSAYRTPMAGLILDFVIEAVMLSNGKLLIEYPRREFAQ